MSDLRIGDTVEWTSQSQGNITYKIGEIVGVVQPYTELTEKRLERLSSRLGISVAKVRYQLTKSRGYRENKSFLVMANGRLYWPNTHVLLNQNAVA